MLNNNYFKVAFRNILKTKLYSFLNIIGLSIGLLGVILIFLYTNNEINYENYHENKDRIYRINSYFNIAEQEDYFAVSSFPIAYLFNEEYPEVKDFVRLQKMHERYFLEKDEVKTFLDKVYYADESLLDIFTHEFIFGDKESALSSFESIMLSQSVAKQIFGDINPVGETLKDGTDRTYKVTAVFKDFPDNVHLKYNVILPMQPAIQLTVEARGEEAVSPYNPNLLWQVNQYSYILLEENAKIEDLLLKVEGFYDKFMAEMGKQINASFKPIVTPLKDLHFSNFHWDEPQGKRDYIYIFIIVSVFLLLIACINYVNLATARSMKRAKEVGIRKVLGAYKSQLIKQFLSESILTGFISLFFAMLMVELILPTFNELTGKSLSFGLSAPLNIYLFIIVVTFLVGVVSGIYPAMFLSSYSPSSVLKGEITKSKKAGMTRKILVVFQYTLSIIMISGTLIVITQLKFLRNYDIGFDKDNVVVVSVERQANYSSKYLAFKNELLSSPFIENMATANQSVLKGVSKLVFDVHYENETSSQGFNLQTVDPEYFEVMGIEFVDGKTFDSVDGLTAESAFNQSGVIEYIINESALKSINWKDNNRRMNLGDNETKGKVIGVVKDFHYYSLRNPIEPLVFLPNRNYQTDIHIRISHKGIKEVLPLIESVWKKHFPDSPLEYSFMDSSIEAMYQTENKLSQIFTYFAIMCIFISCLGIIGLATFSIQQRTKEIGVRKILGASKYSIVMMLNAEFTKLVNISGIISLPISYIVMSKWLDSFTYKVSFPYISLIFAFILAWLIAWITVSVVTYKIAISKPVDAIRYE